MELVDKDPHGEVQLAPYYGPAAARQVILQCCTDYAGLPDVRTMDFSQIQVFYEGLSPALIKSLKG